MSTEAKKAEALSSAEMSSVAGGAIGSSKDGSCGGGEFLVGQQNDSIRNPTIL